MTAIGIIASAKASSIGFKAALGNNGNGSGGATIAITTTAAIVIGDLVVVRIAADNLSATTPTFTCADSGGNTYTTHIQKAQNASSGLGVAGAIMATKATAAVAIGGTITVTLSATVSARALYAESFIGFDNTLRNAGVSASGAGTASTVTSGTATNGDLVVGAVVVESRATPGAYDTDTVNGSWSTAVLKPSTTSGTDASCVEVAGQNKVVTADGAQTYNLTNANTDWAAMVAIFQKTP